ncbi:MAG: hypothetical protein ACYS6K_05730 [Planctomycetota bacterium]
MKTVKIMAPWLCLRRTCGDAGAGTKQSNGVAWFRYVGTVAKT